MTIHIQLVCSVMFLPYTWQFYLKSHQLPEETKWGLNLISKEKYLSQLAIFQLSKPNDLNSAKTSLKKHRETDVHFSITNSLDVLRERMLGAIRRKNRKPEVSGLEDCCQLYVSRHIKIYFSHYRKTRLIVPRSSTSIIICLHLVNTQSSSSSKKTCDN